MTQKPVRNDRAVINAIRSIRKDGTLIHASVEEKLHTLRILSRIVERMKFDQNHRQVTTSWRKLVTDCFPNDKQGQQRFTWVDAAILGQR